MDKTRMTHYEKVKVFCEKAGQHVNKYPQDLSKEDRITRARLIMEECMETIEALGVKIYHYDLPDSSEVEFNDLYFHIVKEADLVKVMDGIADINVVANGTAIVFGVDMTKIQDMVDDSNLDKFRGDSYRNEHGKWIKPSDWKAPDINEEIKQQILEGKSCCGGKCVC